MSRFLPVLSAPTIAALVAIAIAAAGCSHQEPPTPDGSPFTAGPEWRDVAATAPPPAPSLAATTPARATPAASSGADAEGSLLPQTRDRPQAAGPVFDARAAALWDAIVADDPDRAMPFFFPVGAYQQVKDVGDPAADWRRRLVAAYRRDIHSLHAGLQLGATGAASAKFTALEVPESRARWVEPGEEWNKIGYFRVFGSRLRYEDAAGPHAVDVKSLISWRGAWFVVHLSAI